MPDSLSSASYFSIEAKSRPIERARRYPEAYQH